MTKSASKNVYRLKSCSRHQNLLYTPFTRRSWRNQ